MELVQIGMQRYLPTANKGACILVMATVMIHFFGEFDTLQLLAIGAF